MKRYIVSGVVSEWVGTQASEPELSPKANGYRVYEVSLVRFVSPSEVSAVCPNESTR
jgi:hypothetical protein